MLLTKEEHGRVGGFQRHGYGRKAYEAAGVKLVRVDPRAVKLSGNKAAIVPTHWAATDARRPFTFQQKEHEPTLS